jgi:hypothetical protein
VSLSISMRCVNLKKLMKRKLLVYDVIQWEGLEGPDAFIIRVHGCKSIEISNSQAALSFTIPKLSLLPLHLRLIITKPIRMMEHVHSAQICVWFLGVFAKLRKATISSSCLYVCLSVPRPSVRPSVRKKQLSSQQTNFHAIWFFRIFRISAEKSSSIIKAWQE